MLSKTKDTFLIALATLLINALLFASIPLLSRLTDRQRATEYAGRPTLVSSHLEKRREDQSRPEPEVSPEEKEPLTLPQAPFQPEMLRKTKPEVHLDIQQPDFRLEHLEIGKLEIKAADHKQPRVHSRSSDRPKSFALTEVDRRPRPLKTVEPIYPLQARRQGLTGWVKLRFLVDRKGDVEKVSVISAAPKGVFEESAREAVKQWRFEPGARKGRPVRTWVKVPIRFELSK